MVLAGIGFVLGLATAPVLLLLGRAAVDYYRHVRGQSVDVRAKGRRQDWAKGRV